MYWVAQRVGVKRSRSREFQVSQALEQAIKLFLLLFFFSHFYMGVGVGL